MNTGGRHIHNIGMVNKMDQGGKIFTTNRNAMFNIGAIISPNVQQMV